MDLAGMTLKQKVGQMVIGGFDGLEPPESLRTLIEDYQIGGVVYFARNVEGGLQQTAKLSADLQQISRGAGAPPLWIAIDQEGGMVARMTNGIALMPGNMALGACGSSEAAYQAGHISGKELRALGINLNLAPVLDVNNNPHNPVIGVRSFSESPERVGELGAEVIRGLQDANVVATAKHFPGHGDTDADSHRELPVIPHSRERIHAVELYPFKRAIAAGIDAIMTSHIYFPAFESRKLPATLSPAVLTGLLREELGFQGIIMTDSMRMRGITELYGTVEASVMAVEAGADLVLFSFGQDIQAESMDAIIRAVEEGRLSMERIDQSVERLLAFKRKRGLLNEKVPPSSSDPASAGQAVSSMVGCREHLDIARRISEASITLVKNDHQLIPLKRERTFVIHFEAAAVSEADEAYGTMDTLGKALASLGYDTIERVVSIRDAASRLSRLAEEARAYHQIVIGTYNAFSHPDQAELVNALYRQNPNVIVAALRTPYDLLAFPKVSAYIAAYESRPLALQSTANVLAGRVKPKGRLPVTLGTEYPAGWGI